MIAPVASNPITWNGFLPEIDSDRDNIRMGHGTRSFSCRGSMLPLRAGVVHAINS